MKLNIAVLPGDGIGPEVTDQAIKVLKAIALEFDHTFIFNEAKVGAIAIEETGDPLPEATLKVCKENDAILFGAIGHPKYDNNPDAKVRPEQGLLKLRKSLGLFANIRPVKAYDTLLDKSPLRKKNIKGTDISIYRELTGGIYFGEKKLSADGNTASDSCIYSRYEIERIAHLAFKASQSRRNKVTLIDKANVFIHDAQNYMTYKASKELKLEDYHCVNYHPISKNLLRTAVSDSIVNSRQYKAWQQQFPYNELPMLNIDFRKH